MSDLPYIIGLSLIALAVLLWGYSTDRYAAEFIEQRREQGAEGQGVFHGAEFTHFGARNNG